MRLKIDHKTHYKFDAPVSYALSQVRLTPKQRADQKNIEWKIEVEGGSVETHFIDHNANRVDLIAIEPGCTELIIRSFGEVETSNKSGIIGEHSGFSPLWLFKRNTELTKSGPLIRELANTVKSSTGTDIARLHALSANIISKVAYVIGKTNAETSAEQATELACGVCQDHAHIFISAARLLGFPARYVSGYLLVDDQIDQDATHAWAEAYIENIGWVGFDVSNQISPDERYVRVATGQDYNDAAPINGMRFGASNTQNMLVTLQVQQ